MSTQVSASNSEFNADPMPLAQIARELASTNNDEEHPVAHKHRPSTFPGKGLKAPRKKPRGKKGKAQKAPRTQKSGKASAIASTAKDNGDGPKKHRRKRRWRPGTVALREIRDYQRSTKTLLRRLPFRRLVVELMHKYAPGMRIRASALQALQVATEDYITDILGETQITACVVGKMVTIMPRHLRMVLRLMEKKET